MSTCENIINDLTKAAAIAADGDITAGHTIQHTGDESTAQFPKFLTILRQVYSRMVPYIDKDKPYSMDDVIELIQQSGVLGIRAKKKDGKSYVNDDDVITISECVVWTIAYLQSGVASDMVPAVAMTAEYQSIGYDGKQNAPWNCILMSDACTEGIPHRMYGKLSDHEIMITKVGKTRINLLNGGGK